MSASNSTVTLYAGTPIVPSKRPVWRTYAERDADFAKYIRQPVKSNVQHTDISSSHVTLSGEVSDWWDCDYITITNANHDGHETYAFVTGVDQMPGGNVRVSFEVDEFQTYLFKFQVNASQIDREHPSAAEKVIIDADPYIWEGAPACLKTEEDFPVTDKLEVQYNRPYGMLSESGLPVGTRGITTGVPGGGVTGLVKQLGGDMYDAGSEFNSSTTVMYVVPFTGDAGNDPQALEYVIRNIDGSVDPGGMPDPAVSVVAVKPNSSNGFTQAFWRYFVTANSSAEGQFVIEALQRGIDWLTLKSLKDNIIGAPYTIPTSMFATDIAIATVGGFSVPSVTIPFTTYQHDIGFEPRNKKLYRSPYRTLRCITPSGAVGDFPIEWFTGVDTPEFKLYSNFDEGPSQTLIAFGFGGESGNYKARMTFTNFPQAAYNADGWLVYLGAKTQEAILNDTPGARASRKDPVSNTFSKIYDFVKGAAMGNIGTTAKAGDYGREQDIATGSYNAQHVTGGQTEGIKNGDIAFPPFENAREATRANEYHAGNVENSLGTRLGQLYWEIVKVTLSPETLKLYDDHLTNYGYKSDRTGVPHVIEWIHGGGAPDWAPWGTYVKTNGIIISRVPHRARANIASIFDGGCHFTNGM